MKARIALLALAAAVATGGACAHEVEARVQAAVATVVTLRYADGSPFAGETFELRAEGADRPAMTGRTDAAGRAVLLLDGPGPWRLRAMSDDGHGIDRPIEPPRAPAALEAGAAAASAPAAAATPDRTSRLVLGLGLVLAAFGALQLALHRRKSD